VSKSHTPQARSKGAVPPRKGTQRAAARTPRRGLWMIAAVVVVIAIAGAVAIASGRHTQANDQLAPAALVSKVTNVPVSVYRRVGTGSTVGAPKRIDAPALTESGKPLVLYIGAEYCPYCATERWAMVAALSRFGTFTGLRSTHSSSTDVFPNTQTFSFHGATYTSKWLAFTGVELQSNKRSGDGYATLDTPTAEQQSIFSTYDRAPYVGNDPSSAGGIPFIDFGGKFVVGGVSYDPAVLQGKSANAIAEALSDPTSTIARGAIGTANTFTAAICALTNNQPAAVCSDPSITKIAASL